MLAWVMVQASFRREVGFSAEHWLTRVLLLWTSDFESRRALHLQSQLYDFAILLTLLVYAVPEMCNVHTYEKHRWTSHEASQESKGPVLGNSVWEERKGGVRGGIFPFFLNILSILWEFPVCIFIIFTPPSSLPPLRSSLTFLLIQLSVFFSFWKI